ncbi:unnamed protein product [Closterium sp. NIES-64]|nr:unnamed protein product [Closterium sp. NIES-64]
MAAIAGCAVPCVTGLNLTPTSQAFPKSSVQQLRNVTANALPAVAKLTVNEARARVLFSRSADSIATRVCVVGCGGLCIDYLATVSAFPHPDDKIRSTSFELADDLVGKAMIAELQADGVDTSHIIVGKGGMSPSTYIIVDQQTNTRTCIHTPGSPPLLPSELSAAALTSLLSGASLAYFDGRLADTTIRICQQVHSQWIYALAVEFCIHLGIAQSHHISATFICSSFFIAHTSP